MHFTDGELVFFNSITEERKLEGIRLSMPGIINKESYIIDTLKTLRKKNILTKQNKLSRDGVLYAFVFEEFKRSQRHLIINNLHLGLQDEGKRIVCIVKERRNVNQMLIEKPSIIMLKLIHDCTYLQLETPSEKPRIVHQMSKENIKNDIHKFGDNRLHVQIIENGCVNYNKTYCWLHEEGYVYDYLAETVTTISPVQMRRELASILSNRAYDREEANKT